GSQGVGIATLIFRYFLRYFLRYFSSTHRTDLSRFRGTFHSFDPVGFAIFAILTSALSALTGPLTIPCQFAIDSKLPAPRAGISAQGQACVTNEIARLGRPPMAGEIAWTCANDPGGIDHLARDKTGVLGRAHGRGP